MLENNPREVFDDEFGEVRRRRLGRSEALRIVGFALSTSDILLKQAIRRNAGTIFGSTRRAFKVSLKLN